MDVLPYKILASVVFWFPLYTYAHVYALLSWAKRTSMSILSSSVWFSLQESITVPATNWLNLLHEH